MTQANCFFCSDRTTIERFGKPYAVQCVNASCGAIGPLRERRCDAVEAWNGIAARLDMPAPTPVVHAHTQPSYRIHADYF